MVQKDKHNKRTKPDNQATVNSSSIPTGAGLNVGSDQLTVVIDKILYALAFHRLVFLYLAKALRFNPQNLRVNPPKDQFEEIPFPDITKEELKVGKIKV